MKLTRDGLLEQAVICNLLKLIDLIIGIKFAQREMCRGLDPTAWADNGLM
jgi:hypothetical protein